jgi:hypothetical protein
VVSVIDPTDIRRLPLGHFTVPDDVDDHRVGQKIVVVAYLIRHPQGLFLFDTGIGEGLPSVEEHYHPVRRSLAAALESAGVAAEDVRLIANCHLHFDHAGGNFAFPDRPIFAQRIEFDAAHEPHYTLPAAVADFDGARFELIEGEAEPLPGVRIVPTPGHVPGHHVRTDRDRGAGVQRGIRLRPSAVRVDAACGRRRRAPARHARVDRPTPRVRSVARGVRPRSRRVGVGSAEHSVARRARIGSAPAGRYPCRSHAPV